MLMCINHLIMSIEVPIEVLIEVPIEVQMNYDDQGNEMKGAPFVTLQSVLVINCTEFYWPLNSVLFAHVKQSIEYSTLCL